MSTSTLTLHHLNNSRSQRILWLLEELEVPYELKKYNRLPSQLAPPEYTKLSPLGQAPVVTDGELVVAESGAIVEYLLQKYAGERFQPPKEGWLDNLYFTHYAEGTLMPMLQWKLILSLVPANVPFLIRPIARAICSGTTGAVIEPQLKKNVEMLDKQFKKHPGGWIAGGSEPTSADFMMSFPLEGMTSGRAGNLPQSITDYVKMIHARPAYKRALEKGGEYSYAKM